MTENAGFGSTRKESFLDAHRQSDVDSDPQAQHHTLGVGPLQAYPGNRFNSDFAAAFPAALLGQFNTQVMALDTTKFQTPGGNSAPLIVKLGPVIFCRFVAENISGVPQQDVVASGGIPSGWRPGSNQHLVGINYITFAPLWVTIFPSGAVQSSNNIAAGQGLLATGFWVTGY